MDPLAHDPATHDPAPSPKRRIEKPVDVAFAANFINIWRRRPGGQWILFTHKLTPNNKARAEAIRDALLAKFAKAQEEADELPF